MSLAVDLSLLLGSCCVGRFAGESKSALWIVLALIFIGAGYGLVRFVIAAVSYVKQDAPFISSSSDVNYGYSDSGYLGGGHSGYSGGGDCGGHGGGGDSGGGDSGGGG